MIARELRAVFESTDDIVDIDDSIEAAAPRIIVSVDRNKAALLGVRS
jgi:multidrug efflux pump subunit AcrB